MKKLIVFLLTAVLLLGSVALAEGSPRKTDFPDNTFVEMDPNYITGVTQRGKTVLFRYDAVTDTVTVTPCMPRELDGETVSIGNLSVGDKYLHVTVKCGKNLEVAYRLTDSEE